MSKFTPGPWRYSFPEDHGIRNARQIYAGDIAIIFAGEEPPLITEGDARLIAAAPDLYTALSNMLALISRIDEIGNQDSSLTVDEANSVIDARAALAKADGE
jgi:hypothetical protein